MEALRNGTQYGKEGINLREGETFIGVVDAKQGPCFFIANSEKHLNYE
jgi:hypothetical protein